MGFFYIIRHLFNKHFNKPNISIFILFYSSSLFAKPIEQLIRPNTDPSHLHAIYKDGSEGVVNKLLAANVPSLMSVTDAVPTATSIPQFRSPTDFEVNDIIDTLQRMGINLIRLYPPSIVGGDLENNPFVSDTAKIIGYDKSQAMNTKDNPTGNKVNKPEAIQYDKKKFDSLKKTLTQLQDKGIQVVFPIIDTWTFLGGIPQFVGMVDCDYGTDINNNSIKCNGNIPADKVNIQENITAFYTQERYKNAFKSYIALLTREFGNFKNIIWETGNELGESARYNGVIFDAAKNPSKDEEYQFSTSQNQRLIDLNLWTREIAQYIKDQYKPRDKKTGLPLVQPHLLMDGSFGVDLGVINNPELTGSLADDNVDIVSNHYYQNWGMKTLYQYDTDKIRLYAATTQQSRITTKPYFVGEFMCSFQCDDQFLTEFETPTNMEDFSTFAGFWSLRGHADIGLHWEKGKQVQIQHTYRTGSYNHNEKLGYSSYHYPGFLTKNSDADYTKQGQLTPKHDVVTRFVQLATALSGSQKTDKLSNTTVNIGKDKNGQNRLVWAGVSGALGYCLFDNNQPMANNDIQFIDKKGQQFAGYPISPSAVDHPYTVRPYQHLVHDCSKP